MQELIGPLLVTVTGPFALQLLNSQFIVTDTVNMHSGEEGRDLIKDSDWLGGGSILSCSCEGPFYAFSPDPTS